MARIQQLPAVLINQIAAGEVVERPASVVKELLENAVDAGSTRIDIEVTQGGIDLIQVVDNGCGIDPEDLPLAFASHATSKLANAEQLFHIDTLGFRGEALASIGSIAQVTLQSRPADQPCGASLSCNGGQLSAVVPWNGSPGTRIEVRHLFYNTPARRKFLKSAGTEMGHITEGFTRLALAHLGLHWTLRHNRKLVYEVPGSMGLLDRIGLFFGSEVRNSLYMVQAEKGPLSLGGYIGDPSCERCNSQLQYLFLNGRWIRDRGLFQAVQDAYRGLLMVDRHPVAFLFVEMPPDQVDVNVHPTKAEVRFRDKETLYRLVHNTVRERLQAADLTARLPLRPEKEPPRPSELPFSPLPSQDPVPVKPTREEPSAPAPREMPTAARVTSPERVPLASASGSGGSSQPDAPERGTPDVLVEKASSPEQRAIQARRPSEGTAPISGSTTDNRGEAIRDDRGGRFGVGAIPNLVQTSQINPPWLPPDLGSGFHTASTAACGGTPISPPPTLLQGVASLKAMQVLDCYLVVEVPPDEVLFIDQHALHERILFEQLQERLRTGSLETQRLLIPETVDLAASQATLVLEHQEALAELGLGVEAFGGGTVLLTSYPVLLGKRSPKAILQAVVDHLVTRERAPSREQLLNDLLSLMACHAAVRGGDRLTADEIEALLAQREVAQNSHHCPHGRPTSLRFSRHDLERHFRRI
jgi:DNA mismatch repair protein MutL